MKVKQLICVCVALLPTIIHATSESDEDRFEEDLNKMKELAERGVIIDGIFKPLQNGHLGSGGRGFMYKGGLLLPNTNPPTIKEVAMKFTPSRNAKSAIREYKIYTYLGAIDNSTTEMYGIPSVYYFGKWDDYILMAITLLDSKSYRIFEADDIEELDVLILFREFTRVTKYIHSRGICHNDINLTNIMFRKNQGFIIDYNIASKMQSKKFSRSSGRHRRQESFQFAKKDWGDFLVSICRYNGVKFYASKSDSTTDSAEDTLDGDDLVNNLDDTMEVLNNIENPTFKRVFVEFAKYALDYDIRNIATGPPFYDQFYQFICEEIESRQQNGPALVSWLGGAQNVDALPDISSIRDPFGTARYRTPRVERNYFPNLYHKGNQF